MATLTMTASNVGVGANARVIPVAVGQATTHGMVLYLDTSDGLHKPADADTEVTAEAAGISVTSATASGEVVLMLTSGLLRLGAILTVGTEYYVNTTAGLLGEKSDITTGDYVTRIGIAETTSLLRVDIAATGVALP